MIVYEGVSTLLTCDTLLISGTQTVFRGSKGFRWRRSGIPEANLLYD